MRDTTIAQVATQAVLRGFERGYQGYFMPVSFSQAGLEQAAPRYHARFDLSPALIDPDGEICGFAYLAVRAERAWIWALGIAPAYRRQGLGLRLLESAIAQASQHGAQSIELEVLVQNGAAQALYHRCGFAIAQELVSLTRLPGSHAPAQLEMRWSPARQLFPKLAAPAVPKRPWQRERTTIEHIDPLWALSRPATPEVHAFYTYNDEEVRITDWSIDDVEDARVLTLALAATFPAHTLALANEMASPLTARLSELGWEQSWRQYRMVRELE